MIEEPTTLMLKLSIPMKSDQIQATLETAPIKAGCYLMKDIDGKVIYVGKAVNLRNRLRSYFHASAQHTTRTRRMVQTALRTSNGLWSVQNSKP